MELSIYLAKILGVSYVIAGLGMTINSKFFKKALEEMYKDSVFVLFGGMMALVIGLLIVSVHNVWVQDWYLLVTLFGWAALVKGTLLFLVPGALLKLTKPFVSHVRLLGLCALLIGVVFTYFGFVV